MSFEIVCPSCGAPSVSSVGICPYCKTVLATKQDKGSDGHLIGALKKKYREGRLGFVLNSCETMLKEKPKQNENINFLLFYIKVLMESDAPSTKVRTLLSKTFLLDPENTEAMDYLDLLEARELLTDQRDDPGEMRIKKLLKRSPKNALAHFLLGSHYFWVEKDSLYAMIHLEKSVKANPYFGRAWGCLAVLYKEIGKQTLAKEALKKTLELEPDPTMKKILRKTSTVSSRKWCACANAARSRTSRSFSGPRFEAVSKKSSFPSSNPACRSNTN